MIKYNVFSHKIAELCTKNDTIKPSDSEMKTAYKKYKKVLSFIRNIEHINNLKNAVDKFSHGDVLKKRYELANSGIELTPYELYLYIYILYIIHEQYHNHNV